ncbi:uncharacterized protein PAF06_020246 [Gastrophryne carolinensis]
MCNETISCLFPDKYESILFPIIYSCVFVVGLLGNLTAIAVIVQLIKKKNILGIYLANLCASDLMYICTLPIWIVYTAKEDWLFGVLTCKIVGFFFNSNLYTTIAFLSCIATDRFIATVFPIRSRIIRSTRKALIVCAVVWLIILGSHCYFLSRDDLFISSQNVELCYEKYPMEQWTAHLNYFRIFVVFLIPLVVLVFCYCSIIRVIQRAASLEVEHKRRITGLLLSMTTIFIICYLPYHVVLFIRSYVSDYSYCSCDIEKRIQPAYRITFALTSLSTALDPFINIFVSDGVKKDLMGELRDLYFLLQSWQKKNKNKTPCRDFVLSRANSPMGCSTDCNYAADYEATLFPIIYGLVFIFGLLGNVTAIGVIYQQLKRKNVLAVYLANLCVSDLLYVFTLPVWIAYTAKEDWQFGALSCKIVGFFFNANLYTTIAFLSCIAVDRFVATVFSFHAMVLRTMRGAMIICVVVWLVILGSHSVFLGKEDLFNSSQNVKLCYEKYPMEQFMAHINYFRIFVVFLIPLILLVVSYCFVAREVHRSHGYTKDQKYKMIGLLLTMTAIFVICYLPYHIVLFIRSYVSDRNICTCDIEYKVRPAYRITFCLTSLSSALDPFINIFVSESVKQDLVKEARAVWSGFRSLRNARSTFRRSSRTRGYHTVTLQEPVVHYFMDIFGNAGILKMMCIFGNAPQQNCKQQMFVWNHGNAFHPQHWASSGVSRKCKLQEIG